MYRQGDLMLVPVQKVPEFKMDDDVNVARSDHRRLVLLEGEASGHAHAIHDPGAALVWRGGQRYLIAANDVELKHEEHATIKLPEGNYVVIRQREFAPEGIHNVAD